ncbi:hypothetical protein [Arsenophonus apicola]|uniref:Uncharacterized protein n=1 Tax=Arsenophonus apicola TaxID=2879119 RepID=A0ABY8NY78_9GAMM|nr:hypothetical protein [Arsenophonus apicola]WGO82210.1 hypothetical protein QG404_00735 [Arsenophonus apicola]
MSEKLSLDIGVNANAGVIDTLISALNELSQQLGGVTGKFTTVTAKVDQLGTKSTSTAKDVHKASDSVDDLGKEASKTESKLGKLGEKLSEFKGIITGAFTLTAIMSAGEQINSFNKAVRQTGIDAKSFQVLREGAQTVGVSFDELSDGVKEFQRSLNSDGDTASQVFKKLGIAFKDSNGKIRDTSVLLRETGSALNNIQDKGARTALAEQVGLSYEMVDAIGKTREEWTALEKKVAEGRALTQDDLEQSEIFRRTFASVLLQLQQIAEKVFATLAPIFNFVLKGLQPVIGFIASVVGAFAKLITFLNKTTDGFWLLIPAALALVKVFPLITAGLKAIGAAILANPVFFGVTVLIIGIIAALEDLYVWLNGGKSVIGEFLEGWGIFPDDVRKMIDTVIGYFSAMWDQIIKDFTDLSNFLTAFFSDDWDTVIAILKQAFVQFWTDLKAIFSPLVNWFSDKFTAIGNWCEKTFNDACDAVTQFFAWDWIKGIFTSGIAETTEEMTASLQSVGEILETIFTAPLNIVKALFSGNFGDIGNIISDKFKKVADGVKKIFTGTWNAIKSIFSDSDKELDNATKNVELANDRLQQTSQTINHISTNSQKVISNSASQTNNISVNVAGGNKAIGQQIGREVKNHIPILSQDQLVRGGAF